MNEQGQSWPVRHFIWCPLCGTTAVNQRGDLCGHCLGEMAALIQPDDRPPLPPRAHRPPLLRFLFWLSGGRTT